MEDCAAMITGTLLVAQGIFFLKTSSMVVGGTAGLALLLNQFAPLSFGTTYFLINVPFYFLAWSRLGPRFTINSVIAVTLVSIFTDHLHHFVSFDHLNIAYSAIIGEIGRAHV